MVKRPSIFVFAITAKKADFEREKAPPKRGSSVDDLDEVVPFLWEELVSITADATRLPAKPLGTHDRKQAGLAPDVVARSDDSVDLALLNVIPATVAAIDHRGPSLCSCPCCCY